jgi:SAM-dependent methyltransferase
VTTANADQTAHWNDVQEVGHWLDYQERYDRMLSVFSEMIFEVAKLAPSERVLDVGCGCGATTRDAARMVKSGSALGVDLSAAMLERGRADAKAAGLTNASFEQADVQVHAFDPASYDAVISRFGIMFFDDPSAAFANLHRATRPGGSVAFVCWQPLACNEWLLVPGAALATHVPIPAAASSDAPGMFAFADAERPRRILEAAGWGEISIESRGTPMLVGGGGTVDDAVEFLRSGSIGRTLLAGADPDAAARALDAVRSVLVNHMTSNGVELEAAVWLVHAVA